MPSAMKVDQQAGASQEKICIVGSGNWGSAIARIVGETVKDFPEVFDPEVKMWCYEEVIEGRKLSDMINTEHENVKYLEGFKIPHNVTAVPDIEDAARDCTVLIFVVPHQYLRDVLGPLYSVRPKKPRTLKAISLIKGVEFDESGSPLLISDIIRASLGVNCSVLMGANVAKEVAKGEFCEATIGCRIPQHGELFAKLFHTPMFRVSVVSDLAGVELCGAIKNVVALAAGFCDGLDLGGNTKAAIMRIGLNEMERFCRKFFTGIQSSTFFESCGMADLITTCYGGRNRKCAEAFARAKGSRSWGDIEEELLKGQKLQGTITAEDIMHALEGNDCTNEFPMFTTIYNIAFKGAPLTDITEKILPDIEPLHFTKSQL